MERKKVGNIVVTYLLCRGSEGEVSYENRYLSGQL